VDNNKVDLKIRLKRRDLVTAVTRLQIYDGQKNQILDKAMKQGA
jgi:hypothetical protein